MHEMEGVLIYSYYINRKFSASIRYEYKVIKYSGADFASNRDVQVK